MVKRRTKTTRRSEAAAKKKKTRRKVAKRRGATPPSFLISDGLAADDDLAEAVIVLPSDASAELVAALTGATNLDSQQLDSQPLDGPELGDCEQDALDARDAVEELEFFADSDATIEMPAGEPPMSSCSETSPAASRRLMPTIGELKSLYTRYTGGAEFDEHDKAFYFVLDVGGINRAQQLIRHVAEVLAELEEFQ